MSERIWEIRHCAARTGWPAHIDCSSILSIIEAFHCQRFYFHRFRDGTAGVGRRYSPLLSLTPLKAFRHWGRFVREMNTNVNIYLGHVVFVTSTFTQNSKFSAAEKKTCFFFFQGMRLIFLGTANKRFLCVRTSCGHNNGGPVECYVL